MGFSAELAFSLLGEEDEGYWGLQFLEVLQ